MSTGGDTTLRRTLTLPLLVFYGVGVTVGAGIFALVGEILELAGDRAPQAFLLAGIIASFTGLAYALLVRVFPRAGGEAVFVNRGLGPWPGRVAGYGVLVTGVVSSAVVALSFAGYVRELVDAPAAVLSTLLVLLLAGVAAWGIRESVVVAAVITLLELGTLAVIIVLGLPWLADLDLWQAGLSPMPPSVESGTTASGSGAAAGWFGGWTPVLSGAVVAFFAFIGFEDIANMAEETVDPRRTAPRAVAWTLGLTLFFYVTLALIASAAPDRAALTGSDAPLANLFAQLTDRSGDPVAAMASVAMVNGILVQVVMAARVLYGMANEGLAPSWFATLSPTRQTPVRATGVIATVIVVLAVAFPLLSLASLTSLIVLIVFGLVNLSLFTLGRRPDADGLVRRFRHFGLVGAALSAFLVVFQLTSGPL